MLIYRGFGSVKKGKEDREKSRRPQVQVDACGDKEG
jgi:hypothetical protein